MKLADDEDSYFNHLFLFLKQFLGQLEGSEGPPGFNHDLIIVQHPKIPHLCIQSNTKGCYSNIKECRNFDAYFI